MNNADQILAVALILFAERGYEGVGVQEIVDAAGVTKPTLYHYFGSKQGVLEALIQRKTSAFLQAFTSACAYNHDLTYTLQNTFKAVLTFAETDPVFYRYFASLRFAPLSSVEYECVVGAYQLIQSRLRGLFTASVVEHGNMKGKEEIQAATFWGFITEMAHLMLDSDLKMDDGMIYRSLHQFEHGIYS